MKACYWNSEGRWSRGNTLWEALSLDSRMGQTPYVIAFSGGGGKTSLIRRLAWEGRERGLKVLVTTTTHMQVPTQFGVLDGPAGEVEAMIRDQKIAVSGHPEGNGKIAFQGWEYYRDISRLAQLVLVEADGSKRLPMKVPGPGEPVIPEDTALSLCVYGLSALGGRGEDVCFRLRAAENIMEQYGRKDWRNGEHSIGVPLWHIIPQDMECLMTHGFLLPMIREAPSMAVIPVFHQADSPEAEAVGRQMLERMGERGGVVSGRLKEEPSFLWF